MENEMMNNEGLVEEFVETSGEIARSASKGGLKMFGIGAVTTVVGVAAYKYGVKPLVKKIKADRAAKKAVKEAVANGDTIEVEADVEE